MAVYEFAAVSKLAVLALGPPVVLAIWRVRAGRIPGFFVFVLASVVICTLLFAVLFGVGEHALERRFLEVAPGGSWSAADEASWTPEEQRIVRSYFGDGGRNVFALFSPAVFAVSSAAAWAAAGTLRFLESWRREA